MDSGFYAATAGVIARTQTLDQAANNLANVSTNGYRGQQTVFSTLLTTASNARVNRYTAAINDYGVVGGSRTDMRAGNIEKTDNPLDIALQGPGFLAVQTPSGQRQYTRNGALRIALNNQLVTDDGDLVLGVNNRPITAPAGDLVIGTDGSISVNGAIAGQLKIVEFANDVDLQHAGGSNYTAPANTERAATTTVVRQGSLESSNVNAVSAAVNLIALQRNAEMLTRAMSAFHNDINRMAVEDLPKV